MAIIRTYRKPFEDDFDSLQYTEATPLSVYLEDAGISCEDYATYVDGHLVSDPSFVIPADASVYSYIRVKGVGANSDQQAADSKELYGAFIGVAGTAFVAAGLAFAPLAVIGFLLIGVSAILFMSAEALTNKTSTSSIESNPQISGATNQKAKGYPVPIVLGKRFFTPYLAAPYFTEVINDEFTYTNQTNPVYNGSYTTFGKDQHLFAEFAVGLAPLKLSSLKLGGLPLLDSFSKINSAAVTISKANGNAPFWFTAEDEITVEVQQPAERPQHSLQKQRSLLRKASPKKCCGLLK